MDEFNWSCIQLKPTNYINYRYSGCMIHPIYIDSSLYFPATFLWSCDPNITAPVWCLHHFRPPSHEYLTAWQSHVWHRLFCNLDDFLFLFLFEKKMGSTFNFVKTHDKSAFNFGVFELDESHVAVAASSPKILWGWAWHGPLRTNSRPCLFRCLQQTPGLRSDYLFGIFMYLRNSEWNSFWNFEGTVPT